MHRRITILSAIAMLAIGFAALAGVSHAQYPPPAGGVSLQSEDTTAASGDTTLLTCRVVGADGVPVPNAPCTFTIVSQPGDDAAVGSITITKLTNAQGIAMTDLRVGSTPGVIVVEAKSGGFVSSVLVTVEGEAPAPPQSPIGGSIQPPSTGSGGLLD